MNLLRAKIVKALSTPVRLAMKGLSTVVPPLLALNEIRRLQGVFRKVSHMMKARVYYGHIFSCSAGDGEEVQVQVEANCAALVIRKAAPHRVDLKEGKHRCTKPHRK